eukprot:m.35842 g.35842  ORF g.35842 m.35842 type:complete len:324 (-) comp12423_c0_seq1:41-1012(-)
MTERFDGILLSIASQLEGGGIDQFLEIMFSFLERKTDFFTGATADEAEQMVMSKFKSHLKSAKRRQRELNGEDEDEEMDTNAPKIQEVTAEQAAKIAKASKPAAAAAPAPAKASKPQAPSVPQPVGEELSVLDSGDEDDNDDKIDTNPKLKPNAGNGANMEKYSWTQTLQDVEVNIPLKVDFKVRGKDCVVKIAKKRLTAGLKGHPPILEGDLFADVRVDDMESTWSLDSNVLTVHLEKVERMSWWSAVLKGEAEINTKKVQPENSKLSDLDDDTRAMVEKMQFDQAQKQMGKPTSDELQKLEMLDKFKQAHPEMDFSNVKMS